MKRILVIEDDPDIALSLRLKLERDGGFEVRTAADGAARRGIALDEHIERAADHLLRASGHQRDVDERLQLRLVVQLDRPLRDVGAQVGDPLEIVRDLHRRDHEAEVARHRLVQPENLHTDLIDLEVEPVHLLVVPDDAPGQIGVAPHERGDDVADRLLDQAAHDEDLLRKDVQLILEVPLQLFHDSLAPSRNGP